MRVTFIVRTLNEAAGGGSHYNAIQYIRALRTHGHTVDVHVFYQRGNSVPSDIPVTIHEGFGRGLRGERDYLKELLTSLEETSDVFFLYGVDFIWGGGAYRRGGGRIPAVVYLDAYLSSMRKVHTATLGATLYGYKRLVWDKFIGLNDGRHIDRFLPCSPYIGSVYQDFGFPRDRFVVLPNIVPNMAPTDERAPVTDGPIRILYVGRLVYDKGIDLLLHSLAKLSAYPTKLTIVGDGELRPEVERITNEHALTVHMLGWVPQADVSAFYKDADIFVHPARYPDPAPRTIVDACSYGLPSVVPHDGGSAWIAAEAGSVFRNGDQAGLTRALEELLSDRLFRVRKAEHARAQATRFEEPMVFPQLEAVLTFKNS